MDEWEAHFLLILYINKRKKNFAINIGPQQLHIWPINSKLQSWNEKIDIYLFHSMFSRKRER